MTNIKRKHNQAKKDLKEATRRRQDRIMKYRLFIDRAMGIVLTLCALLVLACLFLILGHLLKRGISALDLKFITNLPKPVGETGGGMGNAIVGSVMLLVVAFVVGVPIGMGTGVFLTECAGSKMATAVRFVVDVMNGIPSIVYGIFAYSILVLPLKSFSALSGGVALGLMMIPMITRTTENFIQMVPSSLLEAALALGAPRWRAIFNVVIPVAMPGIITGIMIALARVAGETAPLLFTAFGNHFWNWSLIKPIAALPLQIFSYAISPFEDWHRQAWAGAIILISMIFIMNLIAQYYVHRQGKILKSK